MSRLVSSFLLFSSYRKKKVLRKNKNSLPMHIRALFFSLSLFSFWSCSFPLKRLVYVWTFVCDTIHQSKYQHYEVNLPTCLMTTIFFYHKFSNFVTKVKFLESRKYLHTMSKAIDLT